MPDAFAQLSDQDVESKVILDYTSRDFTAIRSQLVGLAKGLMPEWETAGEASDFGTLLMELFAYMGDVMHFYIDRTASEAFLGSAIRPQSVLYIADMLGYTPIGQQSASVTLEFTLDPNATDPITIPVGTLVSTTSNNADDLIVFGTDLEVTLDPTLDVPVLSAIGYATEGVVLPDRLLGVSGGVPNTELVIPDKGVVYGSVSVVTREGYQVVNWTYIANLSLARPTQPMFTTFRDDQELTHIIFGDNASGRIPPVGAEIYVTYRYGVGAEANLVSVGDLTQLQNPTSDDWSVLTVRNIIAPVGGTDPESIDAMRQSIPRAASRVKNRAITLHDYADLALQVPGVAKTVAHGTVYTAVWIKIAPTDGQGSDEYMQQLCDEVEDYMLDKVIVGSNAYAEPHHMADLWQDVYIRMLVHVQKGYNRAAVRTAVDATLRQILAFNNVDFGTSVTIGSVYRAALAVQGVEWAELTWLNTFSPVDDTDPENGDTTLSVAGIWQHSTSLTMGDPGPRHYRRNSTTLPTQFAFSTTDDDGTIRDFTQVKIGDHIVYRPIQDVSSWMSFVVVAAPINNTSWYQINVSLVDQALTIATAPGNNDKVIFSDIRYTPSPDSLGGVQDINTDELLIPRIVPLAPVLTANVTNVALTNASGTGVATITTNIHGMSVGQTISITGVVPALFNGQYTITAVPSTTTLSYAKTNADITSVASTGTVTTVNLPELQTDYPDVPADELLHDGLWVIADGGLVGT